jgi:hypothetical protein
MKQNSLFWKGHVRKISGSYYVALPQDYIRSNDIDRDDVVIFRLGRNGINMTFRKPVKPSEEWKVDP